MGVSRPCIISWLLQSCAASGRVMKSNAKCGKMTKRPVTHDIAIITNEPACNFLSDTDMIWGGRGGVEFYY